MAIVISGVNNNDKITAADGTIDLLSGVNFTTEITAHSFKVGDDIQFGNAGIATAANFKTGVSNLHSLGLTLSGGQLDVGNHIKLGHAGIVTATTFVGNVTGNINNTTLLLQTGGTERARINSDGRLLVSRSGLTASKNVGTKTGEIQVAASGNNAAITLIGFSNDIPGPYLMLGKSRAGNASGNTIVQENDRLGEIAFCGADGNDIDSFGAAIKAWVDGTPGSNDMPGRLVFYTTPDGSQTAQERLRISSNGDMRLGGGTPSTFGSGTTVLSTYNASTYTANLVTSGTHTLQMIASQTHSTTSIGTRSNHNLNLCTNDSTKATITTTGNVGVNVTDPDQKLEVDGIIKGSSYFQAGASGTASNNWHFGAEANGEFRVYSGNYGAGDEKVRITSAGVIETYGGSGGAALRVKNGGDMEFYAANNSSKVTLHCDTNLQLTVGDKLRFANTSGGILRSNGQHALKPTGACIQTKVTYRGTKFTNSSGSYQVVHSHDFNGIESGNRIGIHLDCDMNADTGGSSWQMMGLRIGSTMYSEKIIEHSAGMNMNASANGLTGAMSAGNHAVQFITRNGGGQCSYNEGNTATGIVLHTYEYVS